MEGEEIFPGVYKIGERIATKGGGGIRRGKTADGLRIWDPRRSKLAAAIMNGLKEFPIKQNSRVLYLGAATGTTAGHIADIVEKGVVYAVEFSKTSMRNLLESCREHTNMVPMLQDARTPEAYQYLVRGVNFIYQDIAQPDQSRVLEKNAGTFLRRGDKAILCVKARSIDAVKKPGEVFRAERERLSKSFEVIEDINLRPYHRDHRLFVLRFKG